MPVSSPKPAGIHPIHPSKLALARTFVALVRVSRLVAAFSFTTAVVSPDLVAADAPELNSTWISSIQHLANGNLIVGNFLRGHEGNGAHAFEVTRDKKVVWKWDGHSFIKSLTTVRAVD